MRHEVIDWFHRRNSAGSSWDRHELAATKGDTRISVVLPARNEAATVGVIAAALRRELMDEVPLIDELVVIDSQSTDDTAVVARAAGAVVVSQDAVLPRMGKRPGKGEALWKSLMATTGDIVAFIDSDLRDFDTQYAVGLVGPLLADPGVHYVKAYYDRSLDTGTEVLPAGGGRVTELVARPLLNLHMPHLGGFIQPLGGEYAGRRSLLERIPFAGGYGVEIAMLIDTFDAVGLDGIAQVDLGLRKHRNSPEASLGRMAAQIQLTMLDRLAQHGRIQLAQDIATQMVQFERTAEGVQSRDYDVAVTDRPPMIEVPAYQRSRRPAVSSA